MLRQRGNDTASVWRQIGRDIEDKLACCKVIWAWVSPTKLTCTSASAITITYELQYRNTPPGTLSRPTRDLRDSFSMDYDGLISLGLEHGEGIGLICCYRSGS